MFPGIYKAPSVILRGCKELVIRLILITLLRSCIKSCVSVAFIACLFYAALFLRYGVLKRNKPPKECL